MRILMTSIGRRVSLVKIFKEVFVDVCIVGADCLRTAPALAYVDKLYELPYKIGDTYVKRVLEICKAENIDVVIPLIDPELEIYASYRSHFLREGIYIMVSDAKAIRIALDKLETYRAYKNNMLFKVPYTSLLSDFDPLSFSSDKIVLKPKSGSSGVGVHIVEKEKVVVFTQLLSLDVNDYIAQEYVDFDAEVTTDLFVHRHKVIELCQRKRLKVRGGEVEQAITIKDVMITTIVETMVEKYDYSGVINIQLMLKEGKYYLGEINARFGGGFPLSYYSGANLVEHLMHFVEPRNLPCYSADRYKEGFCMLRYDDAVYVEKEILDERFSSI